jgi:TolB protein
LTIGSLIHPGDRASNHDRVGIGRSAFFSATFDCKFRPAWSPDGKSIVYASRRDEDTEIYMRMPMDGSATSYQLTRHRYVSGIQSSNGAAHAFVSGRSGTPQSSPWRPTEPTCSVSPKKAATQRIRPILSDGRMIAFAWQKPEAGNFDIYIYDTTSQKFVQVTSDKGNNERPVWAPDGKHIAFQSNRSGSTQIYSMTVDGKKLIQLTTPADK